MHPLERTRKHAFFLGHAAEYIAALLLYIKGYRILHRRFHCRFGEIDLIAQKNNQLVFIEVKARKKLADCLESITPKKQEKMLKTIEYFLSTHSRYYHYRLRIDAIFISRDCWPKHYFNVFM